MSVIVRRYRIVEGKHHTGKGVMYKKDDVLESTRQLDKIFINKFVEVSDITPVTAPPDPDGVPPPRPTALNLAAGAAAVLEERLAAKESHIAHLQKELTRITVANSDLQQLIDDPQTRLLASEEELKAANAKIVELEKKPVANKKKTSDPKEDPFEK